MWITVRPVSRLIALYTPLKQGGILGKHNYYVTENGLKETTKFTETFTQWEGMQSIEQTKNLLMLFLDKHMAYIIPKRYFKSEAECQAFYKLVSDYIAKAKFEPGCNAVGDNHGNSGNLKIT